MQATLEELDFSPGRGLDRRLVFELGQRAWIGDHLNILISGPTGGGKSFLACSLGTAAIRLGYSVRYFRTSRLLHSLAQARTDASYPTLLRSLARTDVIILDDWMRDELTPANARDLLEILDHRYGQSFTLVASRVPRENWFAQIPAPTLADAILDRLVHNACQLRLTGESRRKVRGNRSRRLPQPLPPHFPPFGKWGGCPTGR
jgi:DNA replication protein DnaC